MRVQVNNENGNSEKNELLPVLVPGVAVLIVNLDPRYDLCQPFNPQIRILLEKLAYKHVYCPRVPFQCRFRGGAYLPPLP